MSEETEVKNIEWLKLKLETLRKIDMCMWERCEPNSGEQRHFDGSLAAIEKALDFIDELDESGKVVVPKFVADWIEETKKNDKTLVFAICHIYDKNEIEESPTEKEYRIYQWMESNDNEEVFARAWLGGYEVEKEQKILRFGP